jgi:hypothetical protein
MGEAVREAREAVGYRAMVTTLPLLTRPLDMG